MMGFRAYGFRCGLLVLVTLPLCGYSAGAAAATVRSGDAPGGKQLAISLPDVVIESPSIEHLIASRVRPVPPRQLGVRLPAVLAEPEIPKILLPPRPIPAEKKPDPRPGRLPVGSPDESASAKELFDLALAYLQRGFPLEALSFLSAIEKRTKRPFWRAASLFWAGETLLRMRRPEEARARRERLSRLLSASGFRYVAAGRYALAQERCEARDYPGCLALLEAGTWERENFAYEEAIFLKGWAQARAARADEAIATWTTLADAGGRLSLRALVALGHLYLGRGDYARANERYAAAEVFGAKPNRPDAALLAEALHGMGWAQLFMARTQGAGRVFSLFLRRYPAHPLRASAEGALFSVRIEAMRAPRERHKELEAGLLAFSRRSGQKTLAGALRLQLAWKLFRLGVYEEAATLAGRVSDEFPLGRIYRIARIVEGLSRYHLGEVKRAYGVLRPGADHPPVDVRRLAERDAARLAAMAAAFAAFRLKDFGGAREVLRHWAFPPGRGAAIRKDGLAPLWYGEAAFELGDLVEAGRAFRAVPRGAPEFYQALGGIAWIAYRKNNWARAARAFDRVFSHDPGGVLAAEALARAGEARFNLRDYAGALRSFESVERKYRGGEIAGEALYQKAKLLFRRGRFDAAEKSLRAFLQRYSKSGAVPEVKYLLALVPFRKGDYAQARTQLLAFIEEYKDSSLGGEGYLRMADASYNGGNYSEANRLYRIMMTRYPSHPKFSEAFYGRLLSHLQLGEHAKFLSGAREFIDRYPRDSLGTSLAFQIGEVLFAQKNLEGALKAYRDVIARYPGKEFAAQALLRIAGIYRSRKDIDKALDAYETLLSDFPESRLRADGLFGGGETLAGIDRCGEAKQRLAEFLKTYPGHDYEVLARFTLGRCLVELDENDAALPHLVVVMNDTSTAGVDLRSQAAFQVAELYRKQKKYAEAQQALDLVMGLGTPEPMAEALFERAEIAAEKGDPGAAAEYLKLTYRYPDQKIWVARALSRAGEIYEKEGKHVLALRVYQKMEKVVTDPAFREKAQTAIKRLAPRTKTGFSKK